MSRLIHIPRVRRTLVRSLTSMAVLAALGLAAPAAGLAAASDTAFATFAIDSPFPGPGAREPERLTQASDLTGDGVPDVFASSYVLPVAGNDGAGKVFLYSGADRSLVYTLSEPDPQTDSNFGFYINVPGDLNGDGKDDLLVGAPSRPVFVGMDVNGNPSTGACGAPEPNGCNEGQGRAYAFDGATGRLILSMDDPNPQQDGGFAGRMAGAGDISGDGVPDILVGAPRNDVPSGCALKSTIAADCRKNEGEAFIFSGTDGSLIRRLNVPAGDRAVAASCTPDMSPFRCGNMGGTVQSPGDIDRDGVPDQIVDAYSLMPDPTRHGRVYLFSGRTGAVLARIDQPAPDTFAFWGLQDIENNAPGDVTGDGVPDIYVDGFLQDDAAGETNAGRAWIFDGRLSAAAGTGVVAREIKDPNASPDKAWGFAARRTDYNKDGFGDLLVSSLSGNATQVNVIDGRDGSSVLKTLEQPAADVQPSVAAHDADVEDPGPTFGQGLAAPGDLNGDGEPDYAVAAPYEDVNGNQDQGRLYFYVSSLPAKPVATPTPSPTATPTPTPTPTPAKRLRVRLVVHVKPRRDRSLPYRYTARGRLVLPKGTSKATKRRACRAGGKVSIQSKRGHRTISTRRKTISHSCTVKIRLRFAVARRLGRHRPVTIKMTGRFAGNRRLRSDKAKPVRVKAG